MDVTERRTDVAHRPPKLYRVNTGVGELVEIL
jgi:hypothetical protein